MGSLVDDDRRVEKQLAYVSAEFVNIFDEVSTIGGRLIRGNETYLFGRSD